MHIDLYLFRGHRLLVFLIHFLRKFEIFYACHVVCECETMCGFVWEKAGSQCSSLLLFCIMNVPSQCSNTILFKKRLQQMCVFIFYFMLGLGDIEADVNMELIILSIELLCVYCRSSLKWHEGLATLWTGFSPVFNDVISLCLLLLSYQGPAGFNPQAGAAQFSHYPYQQGFVAGAHVC